MDRLFQPFDNVFTKLALVMDPIEKKTADAFAAFQTEQDPQLLYTALNEIEEVQRYALVEDREACKRGLSLLLGFIAELGRHIDPKWDRKNVPPNGVPPPISVDVPVYVSSAIDPAAIADPAIRARYEQDLKTNRDDWTRYNAQFHVRGVEERATDDLKLFGERCFAGSSSNRQEFEELLESSSLSDARKRSLRRVVKLGPWPF